MKNINNKRNTGKEKMKENKHYPYKSDRPIYPYMNPRGKYKIVDYKGNVYYECRYISNARGMLIKLQKILVRKDLAIEYT